MSNPKFPSDSRFHDYLHDRGRIDKTARYCHLEPYPRFFERGERVLDIGCGRGEFLEMLRDKGCDGVGVDIDGGMVAACKEKGVNAVQADVFEHLPKLSELDGLFASNFVEHLSPKAALRLIHLAGNALKKGGVIVLAVPNPQSLVVHLHEFWRDLTHARMYDQQLLEFLLEDAGFTVVASGANEATGWTPDIDGGRPGESDFKLKRESSVGELRHLLAAMSESLHRFQSPEAPSPPAKVHRLHSPEAQSASSAHRFQQLEALSISLKRQFENVDGLRVSFERQPPSFNASVVSTGTGGSVDVVEVDQAGNAAPEKRNLSPARRLFRRARRATARFLVGDIVAEEVGRASQESALAVNRLSLETNRIAEELASEVNRIAEELASGIGRTSEELALSKSQIYSTLANVHTYLGSELGLAEETADDICKDMWSADKRLASLAAALLYLFPPREVYVVGRKASQPE